MRFSVPSSCAVRSRKQRVRLQLRVVLRDDEEARQRALELTLRLDELLECRGVVDELRRGLDGADARPRVRHFGQHLFFLRGVALDGVDEVRDEIGAPLVLVQHLGPCGLDAFILALQVVVPAPGESERCEEDEQASEFANHVSSGQGFGCRRSAATRKMRPERPQGKRDRDERSVQGGSPSLPARPSADPAACRVRRAKQQILPRLGLVGQVAEQVRRMVGDDERDVTVAVDTPAQARDRRLRLEQCRGRALAERDDQLGPDQRDLPVEKRDGTPRLHAARESGCWAGGT